MQLEVLVNRPEVSALLQSNSAATPWCETFQLLWSCEFSKSLWWRWGGRGDTAWMHTNPLCIALTGNTECLEHVLPSDAAPAAPEYVGSNKCQSLLEQLRWLGKALVSSFFHIFFFFLQCSSAHNEFWYCQRPLQFSQQTVVLTPSWKAHGL